MSVMGDLRSVQRRVAELVSADNVPRIPEYAEKSKFTHTKSQASFQALIRRSGLEAGVDPTLVEAVVARESAFDPHALSAAGARGLMQLTPQTAAALGVSDAFDPAQNVRGGARYLRSLLDRFGGDVPLALAAYNAGPGAVERYNGIPPYAETRAYVAEVLTTFHALRKRQ